MATTKTRAPTNGIKRELAQDPVPLEASKDRPAKKAKLLDDSDADSDTESNVNADAGGISLKVNEEYARRFEHNKRREEQQRCMRHPTLITAPCTDIG